MTAKSLNTNASQAKKMPSDSCERTKVRKVYRKRFYYLFISVILAICLFETFRGAYLNIKKYITLNYQLNKLETLNSTVKEKNEDLRKQLKNFTSRKGIEAVARDNLNMVGKGEVLVLIKESPKNPEKK